MKLSNLLNKAFNFSNPKQSIVSNYTKKIVNAMKGFPEKGNNCYLCVIGTDLENKTLSTGLIVQGKPDSITAIIAAMIEKENPLKDFVLPAVGTYLARHPEEYLIFMEKIKFIKTQIK